MYAWHYPLKLWVENRLPGEDSCPLFSCKSLTVSCSSPKQDPRPPFKLFLSLSLALSPFSECQPQHASPKFLPHFLTTSPTSCSSQPWLPTALKPRFQHRSSQSPYPPTICRCCPLREGSQHHCCTSQVSCSLPPQQSFIFLLLLFPQLIVHSHPAPGQRPTLHQ